MTVNELIAEYYRHNPDGHFFDKQTLSFFGERVSEMKISGPVKLKVEWSGEVIDCWHLKKYSRTYPTGPKWTDAFFDVCSFEDKFGEIVEEEHARV